MKNKILLTGFIALALQGTAVQASAQTSSISSEDSMRRDGGSLELGFGIGADSVPMFVGGHDDELNTIARLVATYQWKGLFFELNTDKSGVVPLGNEALMLGFNAYNRDDVSLDIILGPEHGRRCSSGDTHCKDLNTRSSDITGGVRATLYKGDYVTQLIARTELSDHHNGFSASALVGRNWQMGRFNVHGNVKLGYASENMADYYLGISADEANAVFPEYHVGDSYYSTVRFGAAYPLTENWVLRADSSVTYISDDIADSPMLESDANVRTETGLTVNYVF